MASPKAKRRGRTRRKAPAKLSRQRRWQLARVKAGKCKLCGKPREHYAQHCDKCWRHIVGGKPWARGKKGRPPNSAGGAGLLVLV